MRGYILALILLTTLFIVGCTQNPNPKDVVGSTAWVVAPPLSLVPITTTVKIPTEIPCTIVQDCIDYSKTQDPVNGANIQATCDKTCTYITNKTEMIEVQ